MKNIFINLLVSNRLYQYFSKFFVSNIYNNL